MNFAELIEKLKPYNHINTPITKCYKCEKTCMRTIELCINDFEYTDNIITIEKLLTKHMPLDVALCENCFIELFGDVK